MRVAAVRAASAAAAFASPASAASLDGLHDARYCEIIELRAPPNARATVWNTIGLNKCPAAWWNAFDAGDLAQELGDTLVVLNGPRHFLMDSVTASPGRVRSFHGQRLRKVAAIPIRTAADLARTPYTDRVIERDNTWHWQRGRRVYELVAPGGDVYVMQAYAQIVDPSLTIGKLRRLGRRLDLPAGWRYRRAARDLAVGATARRRSSRTSCRTPTSWPALRARPPSASATRSASTARRRWSSEHAGHDRGPRHADRHAVRARHGRDRGHARRRAGHRQLPHAVRQGSITGTVDMPFTIEGGEIDFRGTARFTGGTGAYRGISSGALAVHDHNTLDGQNGVVSLRGPPAGRRQPRLERAAGGTALEPLMHAHALALGLLAARARCLSTRLAASSGSLSRSYSSYSGAALPEGSR